MKICLLAETFDPWQEIVRHQSGQQALHGGGLRSGGYVGEMNDLHSLTLGEGWTTSVATGHWKREEGLARRYLKIDGKWQDHRLFALLREEFDASPLLP